MTMQTRCVRAMKPSVGIPLSSEVVGAGREERRPREEKTYIAGELKGSRTADQADAYPAIAGPAYIRTEHTRIWIRTSQMNSQGDIFAHQHRQLPVRRPASATSPQKPPRAQEQHHILSARWNYKACKRPSRCPPKHSQDPKRR